MHVPKVVVTGGPCSGKTTCLRRLSDFLSQRGVRVFHAAEAASLLFHNGAKVSDLSSPRCQRAFQEFVIRFQFAVEDAVVNYAMSLGEPAVVICDRGVMDGAGYIDGDEFQRLLVDEGTNKISAREGRYDAVFHLVTAAGVFLLSCSRLTLIFHATCKMEPKSTTRWRIMQHEVNQQTRPLRSIANCCLLGMDIHIMLSSTTASEISRKSYVHWSFPWRNCCL